MEKTSLAILRVPRGTLILAIALGVALFLPVTFIAAGQVDDPDAPGAQAPDAQSEGQAEADEQAQPAEPSEAQSSEAELGNDAPLDPTPLTPAVLEPPAPPPTATPQATTAPQPTLTPRALPAATVSPTPRGLTMQAELDVFSGRPNPSWEISAQDAERLLTALSQLPESQTGRVPTSLGYRGIVLQGGAVRAFGYERITAGGRAVVAEGPLGRKVFADRDREFEAWVAATAEGRVDLSRFADMLPPQPRRR